MGQVGDAHGAVDDGEAEAQQAVEDAEGDGVDDSACHQGGHGALLEEPAAEPRLALQQRANDAPWEEQDRRRDDQPEDEEASNGKAPR